MTTKNTTVAKHTSSYNGMSVWASRLENDMLMFLLTSIIYAHCDLFSVNNTQHIVVAMFPLVALYLFTWCQFNVLCSRCYTGSILFVKIHSGSVLMASDCSFHILCILIKYIALKHLLLFNGLCKHGIGDLTCTREKVDNYNKQSDIFQSAMMRLDAMSRVKLLHGRYIWVYIFGYI